MLDDVTRVTVLVEWPGATREWVASFTMQNGFYRPNEQSLYVKHILEELTNSISESTFTNAEAIPF